MRLEQECYEGHHLGEQFANSPPRCPILKSWMIQRSAVTIVTLLPRLELFMATSMHGVESRANHIPWDLEDDRILIDIETEMAIHSHMESKVEKPTQRIPHFLLEGRTLGPLSVLFILALYFLLSPLLSPAIHEYIYRILH